MAVPEKARIAKKVFLLPDGSESNDVTPDCTGLRIKFSNKKNLDFSFASAPDGNRHCAMARGYAEDIGNTYAGAKGDADAAYDDALSRVEQHQSGPWYTVGAGGVGPAPSLILAAIEAMVVANGETVDDERRAKWKLMVADKPGREKALGNPKVKMHFERQRTLRQMAREEAAEKAAASAPDATSDTF